MNSPTPTFWVVGTILTAVLAVILVVSAVCFYRRNAFHEERKRLCLDTVRRGRTGGDRGGTSVWKMKNGRSTMAGSRITPASPPSPAAAAIPVLVAGPHHYYTDPTKYTYNSFYAATKPAKGQEGAVELPSVSSSVSTSAHGNV